MRLNRFIFPILFLLGAAYCKETPCVLHLEALNYHPLARQARIQGEVNVQVKIGAEGRVLSANATSGHELLKQEVEANIRKWIFDSADERTIEVVYEFRLEQPEIYNPPSKVTFDLPHRVLVVSNFTPIDHSK